MSSRYTARHRHPIYLTNRGTVRRVRNSQKQASRNSEEWHQIEAIQNTIIEIKLKEGQPMSRDERRKYTKRLEQLEKKYPSLSVVQRFNRLPTWAVLLACFMTILSVVRVTAEIGHRMHGTRIQYAQQKMNHYNAPQHNRPSAPSHPSTAVAMQEPRNAIAIQAPLERASIQSSTLSSSKPWWNIIPTWPPMAAAATVDTPTFSTPLVKNKEEGAWDLVKAFGRMGATETESTDTMLKKHIQSKIEEQSDIAKQRLESQKEKSDHNLKVKQFSENIDTVHTRLEQAKSSHNYSTNFTTSANVTGALDIFRNSIDQFRNSSLTYATYRLYTIQNNTMAIVQQFRDYRGLVQKQKDINNEYQRLLLIYENESNQSKVNEANKVNEQAKFDIKKRAENIEIEAGVHNKMVALFEKLVLENLADEIGENELVNFNVELAAQGPNVAALHKKERYNFLKFFNHYAKESNKKMCMEQLKHLNEALARAKDNERRMLIVKKRAIDAAIKVHDLLEKRKEEIVKMAHVKFKVKINQKPGGFEDFHKNIMQQQVDMGDEMLDHLQNAKKEVSDDMVGLNNNIDILNDKLSKLKPVYDDAVNQYNDTFGRYTQANHTVVDHEASMVGPATNSNAIFSKFHKVKLDMIKANAELQLQNGIQLGKVAELEASAIENDAEAARQMGERDAAQIALNKLNLVEQQQPENLPKEFKRLKSAAEKKLSDANLKIKSANERAANARNEANQIRSLFSSDFLKRHKNITELDSQLQELGRLYRKSLERISELSNILKGLEQQKQIIKDELDLKYTRLQKIRERYDPLNLELERANRDYREIQIKLQSAENAIGKHEQELEELRQRLHDESIWGWWPRWINFDLIKKLKFYFGVVSVLFRLHYYLIKKRKMEENSNNSSNDQSPPPPLPPANYSRNTVFIINNESESEINNANSGSNSGSNSESNSGSNSESNSGVDNGLGMDPYVPKTYQPPPGRIINRRPTQKVEHGPIARFRTGNLYLRTKPSISESELNEAAKITMLSQTPLATTLSSMLRPLSPIIKPPLSPIIKPPVSSNSHNENSNNENSNNKSPAAKKSQGGNKTKKRHFKNKRHTIKYY